VTVLPFESSTVPAGTSRSGRLPLRGFSRFASEIGRGVPTNNGFGRSSFSGTLSSARTAASEPHASARASNRRIFIKVIG